MKISNEIRLRSADVAALEPLKTSPYSYYWEIGVCPSTSLLFLQGSRTLTNTIVNLTNVLRMKQQHDTCVGYLHIHIAGSVRFCSFYLLGFAQSAYSPSY